MLFNADDFSSFARIRMWHKPQKPTTVYLIFFRSDLNVDKINVLFGIKGEEDSNEESIYTNLIQFEK